MKDDETPRSAAARRAAELALVRVVHRSGGRPEFVPLGWAGAGAAVRRFCMAACWNDRRRCPGRSGDERGDRSTPNASKRPCAGRLNYVCRTTRMSGGGNSSTPTG